MVAVLQHPLWVLGPELPSRHRGAGSEAPPLLMRDLWGERPGVPLNCQEPGHPKYHRRPAALLQGIQQACDQRTLRPCRPCLGVGRGSNPSLTARSLLLYRRGC